MFDQSTQDAGGAYTPADPPPPMWGMPPYSIPWQNRSAYPSSLRAFWETIKLVLFGPSRAFFNIQVHRSLVDALIYSFVLGVGSGIVGALIGLLLQRGAMEDLEKLMQSWPQTPAAMFWMSEAGLIFILVLSVVFIIIFELVWPFIWAGAFPLMLMMLGVNDRGFEGTYCAVAYSRGSAAPFGVIPYAGPLIVLVWRVVATIIGLSYVHRVSMGTAAAAVLVPMGLCGLACASPFVIMFAIAVAS